MNKLYILLALLSTSTLAETVDNRQTVTLTEIQRNHVLIEMRAMLSGTQRIISALSTDDMTEVVKQARLLGLDMKHKVENHLHGVLPKAFMQLGMSIHKDFDLIAADALSLKDPKHTLQQLSQSMNKCVTCHAAYQIRTIETASEARLDEVEQQGAHVMPFDLNQTTHVFSKTKHGGVQQVIAKDKKNSAQIALIRKHLLKISEDFKHGDFSNPQRVHGADMPGLAKLKSAQKDQLKIKYSELPNGSQIIYSSDNSLLINAIHQWFDAQLKDHARHAISGHHNHGKMMH